MANTEGFDEFLNFLADIPEEINNAIDNGLNNTAIMAEADIKAITPVGVYPKGSGRTGGTLRRNWTHTEVETTSRDKIITIGNPVEYAKPVEEGHKVRNSNKFVEGKHMFRDTMSLYEDRNILSNNIISELEKLK